MSNIYHTEPPTYGKVLFHTSFGDIDVELWSKECPKACRNFLQLCMEGYYDNTKFHRIIRKFMVQGGDPEGTGTGGESIYGKPFRDEIHTRIKFNHRGQVAMANENSPNTNHSQFFFTLDSAPHLDKKHTIFGKITGNTIFNALRMGDVDTDNDDRPLEPPRLISVEVLLNPFDDIVPRNLSRGGKGSTDDAGVGAAAAAAAEQQKKRKKGKRDLKLLSFGDEAEEDERELDSRPNGRGVRSAHDALDDKKFSKDTAYELPSSARAGPRAEGSGESNNGVRADEGLRKAIQSAAKNATSTKTGRTSGSRDADEQSRGTGARSPRVGKDGNEADVEEDETGGDGVEEAPPRHPSGFNDGEAFMQKMRRKMLDKKEALERASKGNRDRQEDRRSRADDDREQLDFEGDEGSQDGDGGQEGGSASGGEEDATENEKARRKAIKERAKEFESLRAELKAKHRAARIMTGEERAKYDAEHSHREMLSPLEQMRAKYKKRRKEAGTREDATMSKLANFALSVRSTKTRANEDTEEAKRTESYHGQVTEGKLYEGDDDADNAGDWFTGPLKFKRHIDDDLRGSDGRKADDYAVIDPLKANSRPEELGSRSRGKPPLSGGGKEGHGRPSKGWADGDRGNRRGGKRVDGSERGMGKGETFSRGGKGGKEDGRRRR